ncbi:MAG: DNA primase [Acidobacteriota bacterium]
MDRGARDRGDAVEAVRASASLHEIVAEFVALKRSGSRYRGLCPFHTEKTPSFYVDADKQLFYCFGCGAGGDVFKFLMLHEKLEFPEALRLLAARCGIPLPSFGPRQSSERREVLEVNRLALGYFRDGLRGPAGETARRYLAKRGISGQTLEAFRIGYAPAGWTGLKARLARSLQLRAEERGVLAGVLARHPETGRTYDRFRDRIIFPILNLSEEAVGFGARVIEEGEPKYLNSPETAAFSKGDNLYGLLQAREGIRREGHVILVEGYMDVVTLHQAGIVEAVATLGTGFTAGHVRLLKRFTDRVMVSFDPDAAGKAAARRSIQVLLENGFEVEVVSLPPGRDPDLYVRERGAEQYRARLREAKPYIEYLAREAASRIDLGSSRGKVDALNEVLPFLARLDNPVRRAGQVEMLACVLGIEDRLILQELKEAVHERRRRIDPGAVDYAARPVSEVESRLVRALMDSDTARESVLAELQDGDVEMCRVAEIVKGIRRLVEEGRDLTYPALGADISDPSRELLTRIAATPHPPASPEEGRACLLALRAARFRRQMGEIQKRLESTDGAAETDELLRRKVALKRSIEALGDASA